MAETYKGAPVKQALIAAGGRGKRMGDGMGSAQCKSALEYRGQTMLGRLLDSLQSNGFDNYLVATNNHSADQVSAILHEKGILDPPTIIDLDEGFRKVPRHFKNKLADRFLFVCGHHPVPSAHIGKMLVRATTSPLIMTAYDSDTYALDKPHAFIVEGGSEENTKIRETHLSETEMVDSFTYVRHPYIADPSIERMATDDDYAHIFSTYIFRGWQQGKALGVVNADFPPEFDYPKEFEITKRYLDRELDG